MNKSEIAAALHELGDILELMDENPFKVRAHHNAARAVEALSEDLGELIESGKLTSIKGVGDKIAEKIETLAKTGKLPELDEYHKKIPDGVFDMMKVSGLGPKKVKALWDNLGITTLGELKYACNENRLIELSGFGAKSQENILKGIEHLEKFAGRRLLPEAMASAAALLEWLKKEKSVIRAEVAGSVRRARETVKDIDIVCSSKTPKKVMGHFVKAPDVMEVVSHGETKSSIILDTGFPADLRVVSDEEYPFALHHFTGSREHNTIMRTLAKSKGMKMNEYGLFKGEKLLACADETAIFKKLGLSYIPPELREGLSEVEDAGKGKTPELIEQKDLKGLFHVHTEYSDGLNTVEQVARACMERGYSYVGISDHSRSAGYAGGLSIDDLKRQSDEIDEVNEKLSGFRIFKGVESDILMDGSLDYPEKVLKKLDFVIASVHSGLNMDEEKMMKRIIKAIENPYTTMLGHPTCRLLLAREGCRVDMAKVIDACAENGVIIELNANPHRLDIDWRLLPRAKEKGVLIAINPDAHRESGLDHAAFGVLAARKGGCAKKDILNTLSAGKVAEELDKKRK
ncbi:MAG: DNA polymerase/3'-5' exonuclease PolX [Candidatus Nitrospinota bacterium M3_3B_026]